MEDVILVNGKLDKIILVLCGIFFLANSKERRSTNLSNQS